MKTLEQIKKIIEAHKEDLRVKYGVSEIGVFGSYVRGEQKKRSDVDILVKFEKSVGLFKFMNLENYLSDLIGIKVDLVMKKALKPHIGKHILREVVTI